MRNLKKLRKLSGTAIFHSLLVSAMISMLVWLPIVSYLLIRDARVISQFVEEDTLVFVTKLTSAVGMGAGSSKMFNDNPNLFNMYSATGGDKVSLAIEKKNKVVEETASTMYKGTNYEELPPMQRMMLHFIVKRERSFFDKKVPVQSGFQVKTSKDGTKPNFLLKVSNTFQHEGNLNTITVERNMKSVYARFLSFEFNAFKNFFWGVLITSVITSAILQNRTTRKIKKTLIKQSEAVAIAHGDAPNLGKGKGNYYEEACEAYIDLGRRLDKANENGINALQDISHAVASHLTEIKQATDLIRYYGRQDEEALEAQMKRIEVNSSRIREIHKTISDLAKLERSKLVISPQVFGLQELINFAADMAKRHYPDFTIEHPNIGSPKNIFIQREHFLLIVEALMQNAVKYSTGDEKRIIIQCMDGKTPKNKAGFSITNWGIGVPKGEESRIFERYYRGSNTVHTKGGGVGLGLHMVYKILQFYGAKIEVASVLEHHNIYKTTFRIIFPEFKETGET